MKTRSESSRAINILQYTHILTYFADYYNYRKNKDPLFSYDIWAAELNLKSRSSLRLVRTGKRNITEAFTKKFCQYVQFNLVEKKHFSLLAHHLNDNISDELKGIFLDKIYESREIEHTFLEADESDHFISHPLAPTVQVLTGFKDIQFTAIQMADLLGVELNQVTEALTLLKQQELVEASTSRTPTWKSTIKPFKVKKSKSSPSLLRYYTNIMAEAQKSLSSAREDKHYRSLTLAIDPSRVDEAKTEMEDLIRKLKSKYAALEIKDKSLYRINLQLYPITKKVN